MLATCSSAPSSPSLASSIVLPLSQRIWSKPARAAAAAGQLTSPSPQISAKVFSREMAEKVTRPGTGQRPVGLRRAMSAIQRPSTGRPGSSTRPRRPYSAYTRKGSEEDGPKYETPQTGREWWRAYLKVSSILHCRRSDWLLQETPIPGAYSQRGFLEDLQKQQRTYRFRDTPRAKSASHQRFERSGEQLLPGAYETPGFLQEISKRKVINNIILH